MMDFSPTSSRRRNVENIVPMINVVFLLLIFFLMSAQIAPPDPFEIDIPNSDAETLPEARDTLFLSRDGDISFNGVTGEAVWNELAARDNDEALLIRADAALDAAKLTSLLPRLSQAGVNTARLVTGGR